MHKIKHFLQQSWLLITASFIFGLLIAVTNGALAPLIEQNNIEKLNKLMKSLITDANSFKNLKIADKKGNLIETNIYQGLNVEENTVGFAFMADGAGFADKIKLVIAVDANCEKFLGFKVMASNETPGFGSKIKEAFFSNQFINTPAEKIELVKTGDPAEKDNKIVAITGATVSSEAVVKIFNNSIGKVKQRLQVEKLINHERQ